MNHKTYGRAEAEALVPLLDAILREVDERRAELARLGEAKRRLTAERDEHDAEVRQTVADIAIQKRELRRAREELERLGCSLAEEGGLGVRIPGRDSGTYVWQLGGELDEILPAAV